MDPAFTALSKGNFFRIKQGIGLWFVLAGRVLRRVPAIQAFERPKKGVDARIKSAQDDLG
jgi:hypothetical protein